jgi:hypothetical protein
LTHFPVGCSIFNDWTAPGGLPSRDGRRISISGRLHKVGFIRKRAASPRRFFLVAGLGLALQPLGTAASFKKSMLRENEQNHFTLSGGEIRIWVEQEAIHIKAVSGGSDPAEITKEQALELSAALKRLADTIVD